MAGAKGAHAAHMRRQHWRMRRPQGPGSSWTPHHPSPQATIRRPNHPKQQSYPQHPDPKSRGHSGLGSLTPREVLSRPGGIQDTEGHPAKTPPLTAATPAWTSRRQDSPGVPQVTGTLLVPLVKRQAPPGWAERVLILNFQSLEGRISVTAAQGCQRGVQAAARDLAPPTPHPAGCS